MTDVYRRPSSDREAPARALWAAKMAARERAAFREWAGWVLTGR